MKKSVIALAALVLAAGSAWADTAPGDVVFQDGAVADSLTGVPGDPANGRAVFKNRKKGNCLACHTNSDLSSEQFHGEVGPSLDGVAERYSEAQLRGIVVNAKNTFEDTIMPAFYRDTGFTRVMGKFKGKTILTAQEVEDVVAYLLTLK